MTFYGQKWVFLVPGRPVKSEAESRQLGINYAAFFFFFNAAIFWSKNCLTLFYKILCLWFFYLKALQFYIHFEFYQITLYKALTGDKCCPWPERPPFYEYAWIDLCHCFSRLQSTTSKNLPHTWACSQYTRLTCLSPSPKFKHENTWLNAHP